MWVLAVVGVGVALLGLVRPAQADAQSRVAVIVMENEAYSKIVGSANAPYINSVIPQGQLFTNYFAVINGSLHNYLAMTSGLTAKQKPPQANVFQAIDGTGGSVTWTELEESMTGNCGAGSAGDVPGTTQPLYSRGHDPAYQYRGNSSCSQHDVPLTSATFTSGCAAVLRLYRAKPVQRYAHASEEWSGVSRLLRIQHRDQHNHDGR